MTGEHSDLLVSVLKRAAQRGATAADGYLVEESRFGASVRMGEIETLSHSREQRLDALVQQRLIQSPRRSFCRVARSVRRPTSFYQRPS